MLTIPVMMKFLCMWQEYSWVHLHLCQKYAHKFSLIRSSKSPYFSVRVFSVTFSFPNIFTCIFLGHPRPTTVVPACWSNSQVILSLNIAVSRQDHSYCNPTLYQSVHTIVGLPTLFCKATRNQIQTCIGFYTQEAC